MENISSGCYVIDQDYNVVNVNETAKQLYPQLKIGKKCHKCLLDLDEPCGPCPVAADIKGPRTYVDPIRGITESVDAVEIDISGHGLCHMLVFSTVGKREEYAATLPISTDELTNLALVKALTSDYADVFAVDMITEEVTVFRQNGKALYNEYEASRQQGLNYVTEMEAYAKKYIPEEERAEFCAQNSMDYITKQLRTEENFTIHYQVYLNGEKHYYCRKIARVGSPDTFKTFAVGVFCEDELVLGKKRNKELEKRLAEMERDGEIGLYTRNAFIKKSAQLLKKYDTKDYDFCICRLENLNMIQHQYGYVMGERILSLIGQCLAEYEEEDNCIGYLGDGVYASFTPNTPKEEREAAVLGFRDDLMRKSETKAISIKWSIYTRIAKNLSIDEIIEKTNFALSIIRLNNQQDYIEFDQNVIERMEFEHTILKRFEGALEKGEFVAWYQPKYQIKTGKICGAEALVRWQKPNGEMISPGDFIPVLEMNGKIDLLDEYVFRQVCRLKGEMAKLGMKDYPVSVNLSRASLFKRDIAANYKAIAEEYGVDPGTLPIEITESAAVRAKAIQNFASRLIEAGFPIHMDDFGSGYSSLASLQMIPFACIKLDKALIDNIGIEDSEKLLKHTVAFAKECGKTVIAEGVESYEQLMFLKVIGCDIAQGFYYSKPVPQEDYLKAVEAY